MARLPRLTVPGQVHHVIQRGNNRQPIVHSDADRQFLLDLIGEQARQHRVALHAYVLMDTHFHLLLTPETDAGLAAMMQAVGRRYVRYFNDLHHRSGTLWEGRYRSTVVQDGPWVLQCMAYLDLNPVRAALVVEPAQYPWSSHRHGVGQSVDRRLTPPAAYWALGNTPFAREAAYAHLVKEGLSASTERAIVDAALHGWALGDPAFLAQLQQRTSRRVSRGRPGRPPSANKSNPPS